MLTLATLRALVELLAWLVALAPAEALAPSPLAHTATVQPVPSAALAAPVGSYVPLKDQWETRAAGDVGMDAEHLAAAVEWAKAQETDTPRDFSTQAATFGRPLGPVPATRALTNGVILRHGYIVAQWGDTRAVDPTYSVAKSYLSTLLGLTIDRGLIASVTDPVGPAMARLGDNGYDTPHNSKVTWAHHATQTSEWDGTLFGKPSTFIGAAEFGRAEMKPRDLREPGSYYEYNDVRINRMALSLLRLWKRPLPDVLKTEIMDPIGASDTWVYHGYGNSAVDVDGKPMKSVSGGTRWGGGLWMSTLDHARFGLLILRRGQWSGTRIISESWIREATSPQGRNPGYGYLWWLNTETRPPAGDAAPDAVPVPTRWPAAPATSFAAVGAGNNTIWIDPEHDLVIVWRWHKGGAAQAELCKRVLEACK